MTSTTHLFYQGRGRRPRLERAEGVYLWDVNGKRYLDGSSGAMICNIGHSDPRVLEAMQAQMQRSTFGYRLQFETAVSDALAERLAGACPGDLDRVFMVSGGSEAVESAIKLARCHAIATGEPERVEIISHSPSYHGCTLGALALTDYGPIGDPFAPMLRAMPKIPAPRAWLDGRDPADPATGEHYAAALEHRIQALGREKVLAFIVEPVGGASTGALVPPAGYLQACQAICRRHGVLLIADEVMTGVCRTGPFLACSHWSVSPDIVALAKGLGAGYIPLGAMVARSSIVETVLDHGGFPHGFTSAGNPLASAAGLAVMRVIEEDALAENVRRQGERLQAGLCQAQSRHACIGHVRGVGLLQAIEFIAEPDTRAPFPAQWQVHDRFVNIAHEEGLIAYSRRSRHGYAGDHCLIAPPLSITTEQLDELLALLERALSRLSSELQDRGWRIGEPLPGSSADTEPPS